MVGCSIGSLVGVGNGMIVDGRGNGCLFLLWGLGLLGDLDDGDGYRRRLPLLLGRLCGIFLLRRGVCLCISLEGVRECSLNLEREEVPR